MGQGITLSKLLADNAVAADREVDKFCDRAQALRDQPLGPQPGKDRDAALYLASRVDYAEPFDQPPGALALPRPLRARFVEYQQDWLTRITDADLAGLDFSWMAALAQFDHWSLSGDPRYLRPPPGNPYAQPVPDYLELLYWAKLRYAAAARAGDWSAAYAQVNQLATLIRSQQILLAQVFANMMLALGEKARPLALQSGADISADIPVDVDQLLSLSRLDRASLYFTYPGVSDETMTRALRCAPAPCLALLEGAGSNRALGMYVESDHFALIERLAQQLGCELGPIERMGQSSQLDPGEAIDSIAPNLSGQLDRLLGD